MRFAPQLLADENDKRYVWEIERHGDLAEALNLPRIAVGFGYASLAQHEIPEGLDIDDCCVIEGQQDG